MSTLTAWHAYHINILTCTLCPAMLFVLTLLLYTQGDIIVLSGSEVDREASTGLQINSAGEGVISFDIIAANEAVDESFTATATVSPQFPQWGITLQRVSPFQVTVRILDINDNSPVFVSGLTTSVSVLENSPTGTLLTVLSATDADAEPNFTAILYSITSGNPDGKNNSMGLLIACSGMYCNIEKNIEKTNKLYSNMPLSTELATPAT